MSEVIERIGMSTPHVGAFIRDEILDELGLSVARAAEILGVRRATLSDLVNEKAALSPEMALRLEKAFGVKMDLLLKMQAQTGRRCLLPTASLATRKMGKAFRVHSRR